MLGRRHLREQHPIGAVPTVHNPSEAATHEHLVSMIGDPGIRLAETTGRATRTYPGGFDLIVQKFHRPAGPNTEDDLAGSVVSVSHPPHINSRRGRLPFGD